MKAVEQAGYVGTLLIGRHYQVAINARIGAEEMPQCRAILHLSGAQSGSVDENQLLADMLVKQLAQGHGGFGEVETHPQDGGIRSQLLRGSDAQIVGGNNMCRPLTSQAVLGGQFY